MEDALAAADEGADILGLVFAPSSRQVTVSTAASIVSEVRRHHQKSVKVAGVFVDAEPEAILQVRTLTGIDFVQLHGNEPPIILPLLGEGVIRALHVDTTVPSSHGWELASWLLFDTRSARGAGGTGESFDWTLLEGRSTSAQPCLLAGGLDAHNVRTAIQQARPDGVDVSSGVESAPGRKDPKRIRDFIRQVRNA